MVPPSLVSQLNASPWLTRVPLSPAPVPLGGVVGLLLHAAEDRRVDRPGALPGLLGQTYGRLTCGSEEHHRAVPGSEHSRHDGGLACARGPGEHGGARLGQGLEASLQGGVLVLREGQYLTLNFDCGGHYETSHAVRVGVRCWR